MVHFTGPGTKVPKIFDCYFECKDRSWPESPVININCRGGLMWNSMIVGTFNIDGAGNACLLVKLDDGVRNWNTASTMGATDTDGTVNFYVENCTFKNVGQCPDIDDHGRFVARHCVFDGSWGLTHGFTSAWGGRHFEYYDNVFKQTTAKRNLAGRYFWCRAGTGIFTDNEVNQQVDPGYYGNNIQLDIGDNTSPGSYPQPRQPGWGSDGTKNIMDPIYIWNQTGARAYAWAIDGSWTSIVKEDREIYVNKGAKPAYSKFSYPHPLRSDSQPSQEPPSIISNPQSVSCAVGQSASFVVGVTGTGPMNYQWQKNLLDIAAASSPTLTISSVQAGDAGSYRCLVSNAYGSATSSAASLSVSSTQPAAPSITAQPQNLSLIAGQAATFNVGASGDVPLTYQWQKNGGNVSGATSPSYTIASVASTDAGSYRCIVSNGGGSATSAAATLTVSDPATLPAITAQPQSLVRTEGQSATFSVTAGGSAPLWYQWQKNSANLAGATAASYTIAAVRTNDAGSFRCVVSNGSGSSTSAAATLTVNATSGGSSRYVDFASGSDANAGTMSSPWKRCPGMVGWTGSATLQSGDTVFFNLGRTWDIAANSSGPGLDLKAGVHYIGNQWDPQGTGGGRAVLRATGRHETGVVRFWEDHATLPTWLEGFEVNANGQRANLIDINHSYWKVGLTRAVKRIQACVAHDNAGDGSQGDYKYGIIVSDPSPDASGWVANVEILDSVVYNVPRDGICLYPGNSGMISNVVVRGCEVYGTGSDPSYFEGHGLMAKGNVKNSVFEYCYAHDVNSSALFINGPESGSGPGPSGCVARYNILQTADNNGVIRFYGTGSKSFDIVGNIMLENEATGGLSFSGNSGSITARIYNNTFYNAFVDLGNPTSTGTIEFRNNIIYELDDIPLTDSGSDISQHSNNLLFRLNGGTLARIGSVNYGASTLRNWEPTSVVADPGFMNVGALPAGFIHAVIDPQEVGPMPMGLSLAAGSPALNVGMNLGAAYAGSINAKTRPVAGAWDAGAYQITGVIRPASPNIPQ